MKPKHLIVFTCNWHAYQGMEMAGTSKLSYDARILPVRLACLSRMSAGIILKAFEQGALGVLLLGCPQGSCQYEPSLAHAKGVMGQVRKFLDLLGYSRERLRLGYLTADTEQSFAEAVTAFLKDLDALEDQSKNATVVPILS